MQKRLLLLSLGFIATARPAPMKENPFGVLELSPFAGIDMLEDQKNLVMEKRLSASNSTQERKQLSAEIEAAYEQLKKAEDWRLAIYYLLVNGAEGRSPRFYGISSDVSRVLVDFLLEARRLLASKATTSIYESAGFLDKLGQAIQKLAEPFSKKVESVLLALFGGKRYSPPSVSIIDSNRQIEKEYNLAKRLVERDNKISADEKEEVLATLERAYIVLTQPWLLQLTLNPVITAAMEKNEKPTQEEIARQADEKKRAREEAERKRKQEQEERERIAAEKEAERKKNEQEKAEQARKRKEEQEELKRKKADLEAAQRKKEEQMRREVEEEEAQKAEYERMYKRAEIDVETEAMEEKMAQKFEWKAPVLTFIKAFPAPEKTASKVTFELKNKTRNYKLKIDLLQDGKKNQSVTDAYKDEAVVAASTGKEESEHGYLRMIGLDPQSKYKLIITLVGQSGDLTTYAYNLATNHDRKRILLTFEKKDNDFVLRPQKGALFSNKSQSGIPLEGNIKSSDISKIAA